MKSYTVQYNHQESTAIKNGTEQPFYGLYTTLWSPGQMAKSGLQAFLEGHQGGDHPGFGEGDDVP